MFVLCTVFAVLATVACVVSYFVQRKLIALPLALAFALIATRLICSQMLPEASLWLTGLLDLAAMGTLSTTLLLAYSPPRADPEARLHSALRLSARSNHLNHFSLEQSEELTRQLAEQCIEIERITKELLRAKEASSSFIANLSHEIRQPLTAILGFAEMLSDAPDPQEAREIGFTISRNGNRLMELLSDVLDLANLESGKLTVANAPCGPRQVLEEVVDLLRPQAEAKGLKLNIQYGGMLPEVVTTDISRLRQTLVNLVNNAIRFTPAGTITLIPSVRDPRSDQAQWEIQVVDTGVGMCDDLIDRLFQPFSRATGRTDHLSGSGLGLAICRRITELLGGSIAVESQPGQGSTFTLAVPIGSLGQVRMIDPNQQQVPQPAKRCGNSYLNGTILVVEDSRDNQRLISFVLKKAGAKVELADDGAQGVAAILKAEAENKPYDLILMDMQMPVLNGFDATIHLRSVGFVRPIVALTALALEGDRKRCLDAGCDDYITKPIDRDILLQVASDFANRTSEYQTPVELIHG